MIERSGWARPGAKPPSAWVAGTAKCDLLSSDRVAQRELLRVATVAGAEQRFRVLKRVLALKRRAAQTLFDAVLHQDASRRFSCLGQMNGELPRGRHDRAGGECSTDARSRARWAPILNL